METRIGWAARAWLPYLLAGALWITLGTVVLGGPQGLGLIFVGLACLAFGAYGAACRARDGRRRGPAVSPSRRCR
jgi:hypothetical protein